MIVRTSYLLMVPLLGLIAIFQSTVGPRLTLINVRPDLVLVVVVAWTIYNGSRVGIVWGFTGGLWMDFLGGGPMGASSLALMAAALVAGIGYNRLFRSNPLVPFSLALVATLIYALTYLGILALIGHRLDFNLTILELVLPSMLYNSVLMLLLTPLFTRWLGRRELEALE
jgi:rod shape-determining protein MreD